MDRTWSEKYHSLRVPSQVGLSACLDLKLLGSWTPLSVQSYIRDAVSTEERAKHAPVKCTVTDKNTHERCVHRQCKCFPVERSALVNRTEDKSTTGTLSYRHVSAVLKLMILSYSA